MISEFPAFTKLDLRHAPEIQALTAPFDPYSDFNFTSLFAWDTDGSAEISVLNQNLIIRLPDYITGEPVVSLLGNHSIDQCLDELLTHVPELKLVPEATVKSIQNPSKYTITEDEDNFDYVYRVSDIAQLAGGQFKKKRNKVYSALRALSGSLSTATVHNVDEATSNALLTVFEEWKQYSAQTSDELAAESAAFQRLLRNADHFKLVITLLKVHGKAVAFSMNEIIDDRYGICHFEKALPVHPQIYALTAHLAAKDLQTKGCQYVNWEQDLGLPGLRKAKRAYHPQHYLKKYFLAVKA